jgi:hypothetical protein
MSGYVIWINLAQGMTKENMTMKGGEFSWQSEH